MRPAWITGEERKRVAEEAMKEMGRVGERGKEKRKKKKEKEDNNT